MREFFPILLTMLWMVLAGNSQASEVAFGYTNHASNLIGSVTVVDARAEDACLHYTVRGAHCLPAADFLGPHGRLASFREIYWLLGTAGLSEQAHVLVVGDDPTERDFVAGMLYLCGQRKVSILTTPIARGAGLEQAQMGQGTGRGMTRNPIYLGVVREGRIVLRDELAQALTTNHPPLLLDGRSEGEYWGARIRAMRGGHLPGAQSLPMLKARQQMAKNTLQLPLRDELVVYANDPFESVAYFTLLRAGAGAEVRVFQDGWVDWANHPALPMDSVTYPDAVLGVTPTRQPEEQTNPGQIGLILGGISMLTAFSAGFFYLGKRRS
ncbi:MAG TPA: rhodanese-like domain-containing protein [Sulfuriferula sp.]|nr:rhodanese-like domain-containing protein [Sulfuriferula sp.]